MEKLKPTYRTIFDIAYPLILGNLAWTIIGITDQAFMGRVGRVEEAAIGPVSILYSVLFMIGFGYTRGTQMLIARKLGEGEKEKVGHIFDNTFVLMTIASLLMYFLITAFGNVFLQTIMNDQAVIEKSSIFLYYRIFGLPASFLSCNFISFYSGIGKTKVVSLSVGIMAIINILLNYLLVFGKFGLEPMGIAGSAIASVIAEWISLFILLFGITIKNRKKEYQLFTLKKINFSFINYMTKVSAPLVIQSVLANGAWFLFFTYIEKLGQEKLAVSNYMRSLLMFIGIPVWALGSVTNTLVSNLIGQNKWSEVQIAVKKLSVVSISLIVIQCAVLLIFPRQILNVFTIEQSQIDFAIPVLYVLSAGLILMSFTNILFNAVVCLGNTNYALYIEAISITIYCVYFLFLFQLPNIDLAHVWTTEWVYWAVICLLSFYVLRKKEVHFFG